MGIYGPNLIYEVKYIKFNQNLDNLILEIDSDYELLNTLCIAEGFGSSIKSIWDSLVKIVRKIKTVIQNFTINIDYLKAAKIPKQQFDDVDRLLNQMTPRTIAGTTEIMKEYINVLKSKQDPSNYTLDKSKAARNYTGDEYFNSTLSEEINKSLDEISICIRTAENSPEFNRLKNNEYKLTNITTVNLRNIITDMKSTRTNCTEFENGLTDILRITNNNSNSHELDTKMINLCRQIIHYNKVRINILQIFFRNARLSWQAIRNNSKEMIAPITKLNLYGNLQRKTIDPSDPILNDVEDCIWDLDYFASAGRTNEYTKTFERMASLLQVPKESPITIFQNAERSNEIHYSLGSNEKIYVGGRNLYHVSTAENIHELIPRYIGNNNITYYPDPRIYLHISYPLNKSAEEISPRLKSVTDRSQYIYKVLDNIDYVYKDTSMGGTGSFVITDKPIKVKKISYDEWKKENGLD